MADIVDALLTAESGKDGREFRVLELFGDQPEILDAVRTLRARGVSYRSISKKITEVTGHYVSANGVQNWLEHDERHR
jgi:hypothetical protein